MLRILLNSVLMGPKGYWGLRVIRSGFSSMVFRRQQSMSGGTLVN